MENYRHWVGRGVSVRQIEDDSVAIRLRPEVASNLIKTLGRVQQTTFALPGQMAELKQALEYVITGDEASERAHRQMEAGKGMTPDGGHKAPEDRPKPDRPTNWRDREEWGPRYS